VLGSPHQRVQHQKGYVDRQGSDERQPECHPELQIGANEEGDSDERDGALHDEVRDPPPIARAASAIVDARHEDFPPAPADSLATSFEPAPAGRNDGCATFTSFLGKAAICTRTRASRHFNHLGVVPGYCHRTP
jgi:hypothetical protein